MSDAVNKPAHYNQGPIECIEAMKIVLTPEEFRGYLKGNVFKYLWREKDKNGNEDLRKGKDYYDRLIQSFDESEDQPVIKQSSTTEPPDGWRWLEVGELIRKGDRCFTNNSGSIDCLTSIGEKFNIELHYPTIRRNRFEVGEKVIEYVNNRIGVVQREIGDGKYVAEYEIEMLDTKRARYFFPHRLAPYIEEQS